MLQLSQLHLQLALMGSGSLRKDIENQAGTIQHATLYLAFKIAFLGGAEGMIEDHQLGLMLLHQCAELCNLAGTEKEFGTWIGTGSGQEIDRISTRGERQLFQFPWILTVSVRRQLYMDEYCALARFGTFKKQLEPQSAVFSSPCGSFTGRDGTTVEMACL